MPLVIVALLLFCSTSLVTGQGTAALASQEETQQLVENVEKMTQTLYSTIRAVAYPDSPQLEEDKANVDTRFILLSPGKTLNYLDYYPGQEYTQFLQVQKIKKILFGSTIIILRFLFQNPSSQQRYAVVPPHVMEKWFDLADVMPSANPFKRSRLWQESL